jgi:hypothetical protein
MNINRFFFILAFGFVSTLRAEDIRFPSDAGLVDVTKAPYNAKGDGRTDDTQAIQNALDENWGRSAIIYSRRRSLASPSASRLVLRVDGARTEFSFIVRKLLVTS